jgi:hypothetical protein
MEKVVKGEVIILGSPLFIFPERGLNAPICKGGFWEIAESEMVV